MKRIVLLFVACLTIQVFALTEGNYTYTVSNGKATITDFPTFVSGAIEIPSMLGGYPVTSLGSGAFYYCSWLTSVTIPDSVTNIGYSAFFYCTGLTSVTIPDSVTSIGGWAFSDCSGLTSVKIPSSVTSIGSYAFSGTSWYNSQANGVIIKDGWVLGVKGECPSEVVLSDEIKGLADYAFWCCRGLTSVIIPDSVTSIGQQAFCNCTGLTSVTIPDSVTSIGDWAFYDCSGLTSVTIPANVRNIGGDVLFGTAWWKGQPDGVIIKDGWVLGVKGECPAEVVLSDEVKGLAGEAFSGCSSLTSVTIPNSVTSIGAWAFSGCSGLTSVTIPSSVTSIGNRAFSGCSSLTSVTIPNSVTSIGAWAFSGCSGLTSVTIPNSVTSIGDGAFSGCSSLTSVTIPDSVTEIGDHPFNGCDYLETIYAPASLRRFENELKSDNDAEVVFVGGGSGGGGSGCSPIQPPSVSEPCLERADFTFETYKGFSVAGEYEVHDLQGGRVTLKKIGKGKLPSGVKLKYDKKTGKVVLSGAPSKAGTFEYVFRIDEKVGREKYEGVETTLTFVVTDMGNLSSSHPDYNPAAGKKIKIDVPVFALDGRFAGLLNVSISTRNAITAKIKGVSKKSLSFKGAWQEVFEGELCAILTTKTGEELELILKKNGNLCAYLSNITGDFGSELASTEYGVAAVATDFSKYVGERTVTTDDGKELTLKINKKGKVSYKAVAKEDKHIKGSTQVLLNAYEDGSAQVCLIKTTGKMPYAYVIKLD